MKVIIFLTVWLVASTTMAQKPSPETIIAKMVASYGAITSYEDKGVVLSHPSGENTTSDVSFKTYFVRPDRLKFEWIRQSSSLLLSDFTSHHVIWSNRAGSYTYWDSPYTFKQEQNLSIAVAGATGVSCGAAHTVPCLLSDTIGGFALSDLQNLASLDRESFEGTDCFHVRGTHPRGGNYEMWIGTSDYLLRKIQIQFDAETIQEEIHRDIKINQDIPNTIFDFEPPK